MKPKLYFSQRIVFTFAVLILLALGFYAYAWTDPSQTPPGGSVSSLIDSGATTQTKTGGLNVLDNLGIGTTTPDTTLDLNGALSVRAMAAPALSPTVQGRIYFDSAVNKFKVSENGGVYQDLVGGAVGGFWTDQGTYIYPNNYN